MITRPTRHYNTEILTVLGNHSEGDNIAGLLDKLDNVIVRELDDGAPVDRWDTISDVQQAAAVGGTAFNDSANFVWNNWKSRYRDKRDETLRPRLSGHCENLEIYQESQHGGRLSSESNTALFTESESQFNVLNYLCKDWAYVSEKRNTPQFLLCVFKLGYTYGCN